MVNKRYLIAVAVLAVAGAVSGALWQGFTTAEADEIEYVSTDGTLRNLPLGEALAAAEGELGRPVRTPRAWPKGLEVVAVEISALRDGANVVATRSAVRFQGGDSPDANPGADRRPLGEIYEVTANPPMYPPEGAQRIEFGWTVPGAEVYFEDLQGAEVYSVIGSDWAVYFRFDAAMNLSRADIEEFVQATLQ